MSDNKKYDDLTSIRIGRVSMLLTKKKPSIIPFSGQFPLVPDLEYKVFLEETLKQEYFDDLPKFIKEIVYKAESILEYTNLFKSYLSQRDISIKEFQSKNPKTKQDIFYDWLFSEQLDTGILEM